MDVYYLCIYYLDNTVLISNAGSMKNIFELTIIFFVSVGSVLQKNALA